MNGIKAGVTRFFISFLYHWFSKDRGLACFVDSGRELCIYDIVYSLR